MASTYSDALRIELITNGEQSTTWGTTTNTNLGTLIEDAIAGYVNVTHTDAADYTLTTANGSVDEARNMLLNISGTLTGARNVVCPTKNKLYVIKNSTTGGFAITIKTAAGTGVTVNNGDVAIVYCDGTNVLSTASGSLVSLTSGVTGILPVANGGTGIASLGTGVATWLGTPSSANLRSAVTDETGTGSLVFATSPTLVTPVLGTPASGTLTNCTGLPLTTGVTGTLPDDNGGTGQSTYSTGDILYASGANTLAKRAVGSTGDVLTVSGGVPTWAAPSGGAGVKLLKYTEITATDATWAKQAGTTAIEVLCVGAGGGGSSVPASAGRSAEGGQAGSQVRGYLDTGLTSTFVATIGAGGGSDANGGTTSFTTSTPTTIASALGGLAGTGSVDSSVGRGGNGESNIGRGGVGGSTATGGSAAANTGAGGGGAGTTTVARNGGTGGSGIIYVWEYG